MRKIDSRIMLKGKFILTAGLHIGSGGSLEPVGSDNPVIRDALGNPFIPASSFKGVVRSKAEEILRTVNIKKDGHNLWACEITGGDSSWCIKKKDLDSWKDEGKNEESFDEFLYKKITENLCSACSVFGSPWMASKVKFKDLYISGDWAEIVEVRDGVAIERDTNTAADRKKFDYEAIPGGTGFDVEISIENASSEELGLIFLTLNQFKNGGLTLGGKTTGGLGRGEIEWTSLEEITRDNLIDYLVTGVGKKYEGASLEGYIAEKISSFVEEVRRSQNA